MFSILTAASGALVTSIGCRRAKIRRRCPGWYLMLLGPVITVLLTVLCLRGGDVFRPDRWDDYKGGFWRSVIFSLEAAAVVALLSSLAVVYYFRGRFRNEKREA
jgi:ABC-type Fe3+ transport system permease subunit